MTTTINASTSSGLVTTPDNSGAIALQSNGTNIVTVNSSGLTFNNASSASPTALYDYQQGTWTPTFFNLGTVTSGYARYTKIGNVCTFWLQFTCTSAPVANSSRFTMPFTANSFGGGTWSRGTVEGGILEPQSGNTLCYFATSASSTSGQFLLMATIQTT